MENIETIEVVNKFGNSIAIFTNKDENTNEVLIDPIITENQNQDNVLTFSIYEDSEKWKQICNIENYYIVNGKIYSPLFEDSYQRVESEDNQKLIIVKAYERQKLLSKKFVRAWNTTTGFATIDNFMVVIVSQGDLPLVNDGNLVGSTHAIGTAGYILDALLFNTGWETGIVDVDGIFDFETEQLSIYDNILKVQELFGGILIFDSYNRTVSLRDETHYVSYHGYEVRSKKNRKNYEENINNSIVTKLCVLGENGLDIRSENEGSIWLENHSYSNEIFEGILTNTDIWEADKLKAWGERTLSQICRPQKTLTVQMVDFSHKEEYKEETFKLNDSVDVVELKEIVTSTGATEEVVSSVERLRIVGLEYKVFDRTQATVELGNTVRNTTDIFKKISNSTNAYNNGTIDSTLVKNFNTGESVNQSFENQAEEFDEKLGNQKDAFDKKFDVQEEKNATFEAGFEGLQLNINNVKNLVDSDGNKVKTLESQINDLRVNTDGIQQTLERQGGSNLLRNSSAYFGEEFWRGYFKSYTDTEIKTNFLAKYCFLLQEDTIGQNINVPNGQYYIGFKYKKLISGAICKFYINDEPINLTETQITQVDKFIEVYDNTIKIEIESDTDNSCYVGDIMVVMGNRQNWSANFNEIFTDTVKIGKGISITSSTGSNKLEALSDSLTIFSKSGAGTYEPTSVFDINGIKTTKIVADEAQIAKVIIRDLGTQTIISRI